MNMCSSLTSQSAMSFFVACHVTKRMSDASARYMRCESSLKVWWCHRGS